MDIVEELRKDRENGAKRLEAEYKSGLMSLARRFCADESDAEELVNSTFATVVENIDDYVEQSAFFGWMCQILTSKFSRSVRRKASKLETYPGVVPDMVDEDAQEAIYRNLDASLLRDAIETLPPDIKKTLLLHYFMDMPVKEVARVLSSPTSTITWRLHYARRILAAKMGAAAKKPVGKAVLLALLLFGLTALGAATFSLVGTSGRDVSTKRPNADALGSGRIVDASLPGAAGQSTSDMRQADAYDLQFSTSSNLPQSPSGVAGSPQRGADASNLSTFQPFNFSTDNSQGEQNMKTATRSAALGAATALALAAAPPAATADYQFIISGNPDYDPPASQLNSAGVPLVAGPLSKLGPADALEARSRTSLASSGTSLRSDAYSGFTIILR